MRSIMSSVNVSPISSAWTCDSHGVYPMKSVKNRSMIRCFRTTRSARSTPVGVEDRLLLLTALDEAVHLEPLQHLTGRRARDTEHLRHARGDRGRARRRPVLADREGEEVDRLQVLVDRMALPVRHCSSSSPAAFPGHYRARAASRGLPAPVGACSTLGGVPLASVYPLVRTRSLARAVHLRGARRGGQGSGRGCPSGAFAHAWSGHRGGGGGAAGRGARSRRRGPR